MRFPEKTLNRKAAEAMRQDIEWITNPWQALALAAMAAYAWGKFWDAMGN